MKRTLLLIASCLMCTLLSGQELIEAEFITNRSKESIIEEFGPFSTYGVDFYKVLYSTPDVHGVLDTASGLLIVPDDRNLEYPMMIYQHGTVAGRDDVPSNLRGGYELPMIWSSLGFVVVAPDYLGLGESRGIHPYVHADTEASAAIDFLFAAKSFISEVNIYINDQLFVTGYSQGGHAAMAAFKKIEEEYSDQLTVTAAAPMSGPYNISGSMIDFTLSDQEYGTVSYLAWVALSYQTAYGGLFDIGDLSTYFKEGYYENIERFRDEEIDLWELNTLLQEKLIADYGGSIPKFMLQDSVLNSILTNPDAPENIMFRDNDVYDWKPDAPLRMYYCTQDEQVFFQNSLDAENAMLSNGATEVQAINSGEFDHGGCIEPAVTSALLWFLNLANITTKVEEVTSQDAIAIYPNPFENEFSINVDEFAKNAKYQIYSSMGELVHSGNLGIGTNKIQIDLEQGYYYMILDIDNKIYSSRILSM